MQNSARSLQLIQNPGRRAGLSDLPDLVQKTWADRDPFLHTLCRVVPLRIARHHDRLGWIDRLCRPQIVAEAGHVDGEFLAVAEQTRIDRDQTMANVIAMRFLVCIGSVIKVAPDRHEPRMFTITANPYPL